MNRFQGTNSAMLFSLAGRYENSIPSRFLAPIDCLKIPAHAGQEQVRKPSSGHELKLPGGEEGGGEVKRGPIGEECKS